MILKTVYPNFEAIPEFARAEYEQQADGSWKMKQDAIEGAAEHFNAGLAANRDRALQQKQAADAARDQALQRAQNAETQLANLTANGGRVFSAQDAAALDNYRALGDVPTLTKLKETATANEQELASLKGEKNLKTIAEKTGLAFDALNEWFSHPTRGANLEPFTKTEEREVEEKDQFGNITKVKKPVEVAYIRKIQVIDGKNVQTEVELLTEAKGILPEFQFNALTAKPNQTGNNPNGGNQEGNGQQLGVQPPVQPFALPMLGGGQQSTQQGGQQPPVTVAQTFQAERDAKPNPFAPKK